MQGIADLSAGSVNFHAKLKIHSTWGSTDLDEIYTVCRLYRVYSIPKIFINYHLVPEKNSIEVFVAYSPFWLEVYGKKSSNFKLKFGHFCRRLSVYNTHEY